jgi:hypothetical protein
VVPRREFMGLSDRALSAMAMVLADAAAKRWEAEK